MVRKIWGLGNQQPRSLTSSLIYDIIITVYKKKGLVMIRRIHDFIPEVKDIYSIDTLGNVYSDTLHGRPLKNRLSNVGYYRVALYLIGGGVREYSIHRLIMMAFKPVENMKDLEVNHIDAVRTNNNINNLEWCTTSENQKWAVKIGNSRAAHQWGEDNAQCVLSSDDVKRIFELRQEGYTHQAIADIYHVSRRHIGNILQGKRRKQG